MVYGVCPLSFLSARCRERISDGNLKILCQQKGRRSAKLLTMTTRRRWVSAKHHQKSRSSNSLLEIRMNHHHHHPIIDGTSLVGSFFGAIGCRLHVRTTSYRSVRRMLLRGPSRPKEVPVYRIVPAGTLVQSRHFVRTYRRRAYYRYL